MRIRRYKQKYVAGAYKRTCDRSGFDSKSTDMIEEERTGLFVNSKYHIKQNNGDYDNTRINERKVRIR